MQVYDYVEDPKHFYLKDFQSKRLRATYADFAEQDAYRSATHFFFNRLYNTEDTTDRDASFKSIHQTVNRYLGGSVADSMAKLIELQDVTVSLDQTMLIKLEDIQAPVEFDMDSYERAYRESDNYADRVRQIELLAFVNRLIHRISHRFGIGMILKALRAGALLRGDTRMVDFLMDGYRAFADLKKIDPLVEAIETRETMRLDRIFGLNDDSPY